MAEQGGQVAPRVIYEVNLAIDHDSTQAYMDWLKPHMKELLKVPGFQSAEIFQRKAEDELEGNLEPERSHWTVHYVVQSRQHLQEYFDVHAANFRGDGVKRFEGKFKASRRVLHACE